jgi:thiosulfate/3-mercaptopyruvate sulfurtransferase
MNTDFPTPLIDATTLHAWMAGGRPVRVFDCSFELTDPQAGCAQYRSGHLPGARYAHLDHDLSARPGEAAVNGGRHPLPTREAMVERLRAWGVRQGEPVVVYDRQGGMVSGRLWWLLRWVGHAPVAVLDGGWQAWLAAGGPVAQGDEPDAPVAGDVTLGEAGVTLRTLTEVVRDLGRPTQTLVDARAAARFRGETEALDPVAGHIPGALNRPFTDNFGPDGRFKDAATLRREWDALLAGRDPATVVHHCGSGVSAIPNLLAMHLAGLGLAPLYAGGWSEWTRAAGALPCARGAL